MGVITELATSAPGYSSVRPNTCAPLARDPAAERLLDRPVRQVPRGAGVADEPDGAVRRLADRRRRVRALLRLHRWRDQPVLPGASTRARRPWSRSATPEEGYHFTEDMTDKAIGWIRQQKSLMPDKPFFVYYAPGATHAPHHVPDGVVRQVHAAVSTGAGTRCARRSSPGRRSSAWCHPTPSSRSGTAEIPAWDDMPEDLKPVLARQMEVYAGFLEHTDHHIGRLVDALDDLGVLDDTLVYYIIGDNGASAEGTINGSLQRDRSSSTAPTRSRPPSSWRPGSTSSAPRRPTTTTRSAGRTRWARRTSGPSRSPRTGAAPATARSCTGRTGSRARGEVRSQFHHVIDVAPTVLEAAGLPEPTVGRRRPADAPSRASAWRYSFDDAGERGATRRRSTSRCSATAASTTRAGPR